MPCQFFAMRHSNGKKRLMTEAIENAAVVREDDHGLSAAPVLVIDLRAVFSRNRGHGILSFLWLEDVEAFVGLAISVIFTTGIVCRQRTALTLCFNQNTALKKEMVSVNV
jgi:hypothetical protein